MCINKFFYRFGNRKQNVLLGVIHNTKESLDMVKFLNENYYFKQYFLELNECNKSFIKKNKFFTSEFFPILIKHENFNNKIKSKDSKEESIINNNRIKLIDISFEAEVIMYSKIKNNFNPDSKNDIFDNYINFKLSKYVFYKIWNFDKLEIGNSVIDFNKMIKHLKFYQSHILFREFMFLYHIKRYMISESPVKFYEFNENNEKIEKYFGENFQHFSQEIENYTHNIEKSQPILKFLETSSDNIYDSNRKQENELLVVIGQYHFDNFVSEKLI